MRVPHAELVDKEERLPEIDRAVQAVLAAARSMSPHHAVVAVNASRAITIQTNGAVATPTTTERRRNDPVVH